MKVDTHLVRSCYTHLRGLPPFSNWKLPTPERIEFGVLIGRDHAVYSRDGKHAIYVNDLTHTTHTQVMMTVAHEMVHLRQELLGRLPLKKDPHNAEFRRLARSICKLFGWDVQVF